ncbi:HNH endonuclease [Streptomyces sp. NPDC057638]|uniref:HNH endonuclease n=1 Tax=Streptomyces sp. NPDC057638 TaxID=3346190 RepID=UPI003680DB6D
MALADITRTEVDLAIKEYDALGRDAFLRTYGFGPARRYLLEHAGRPYDSKAIVGAAHGFLPGRGPLAAADFSGGADHAVRRLRELGYVVGDETMSLPLTGGELVERVANLRVNRSSGRPALFQPITLLWAMGRARRAESRLLSWEETSAALKGLLRDHGLPSSRIRPDYPIAALVRAGLWELPDHVGGVPGAHGDTTPSTWFAHNQPVGGLTETVYRLLRDSDRVRLAVMSVLLDVYFDGLDFTPLLADVGLGVELYDEGPAPYDPPMQESPAFVEGAEPWLVSAANYERLTRLAELGEERHHGRRVTRTRQTPRRSRAARAAVLSRSRGRCENPGCAGQPDDVTRGGEPILEVDHVVELSAGGRDHPEQMVALCPNCHAVKTRGRSGEELGRILLEVARQRHGLEPEQPAPPMAEA